MHEIKHWWLTEIYYDNTHGMSDKTIVIFPYSCHHLTSHPILHVPVFLCAFHIWSRVTRFSFVLPPDKAKLALMLKASHAVYISLAKPQNSCDVWLGLRFQTVIGLELRVDIGWSWLNNSDVEHEQLQNVDGKRLFCPRWLSKVSMERKWKKPYTAQTNLLMHKTM